MATNFIPQILLEQRRARREAPDVYQRTKVSPHYDTNGTLISADPVERTRNDAMRWLGMFPNSNWARNSLNALNQAESGNFIPPVETQSAPPMQMPVYRSQPTPGSELPTSGTQVGATPYAKFNFSPILPTNYPPISAGEAFTPPAVVLGKETPTTPTPNTPLPKGLTAQDKDAAERAVSRVLGGYWGGQYTKETPDPELESVFSKGLLVSILANLHGEHGREYWNNILNTKEKLLLIRKFPEINNYVGLRNPSAKR